MLVRAVRPGSAAALALLVAAGCAPSVSSAPAPAPSAEAPGAVLEGPAAQALLSPCSRPGPTGVSGMWTPSTADVARLEAALPAFLAAQPEKPALPLEAYRRQYAGFVAADGRRWVYASFFFLPENIVQDSATAQGDGPWAWRRVPMAACDGGALFFGVEFDPAAGSFRELHYNGSGKLPPRA
jgi:hypothetical protein